MAKEKIKKKGKKSQLPYIMIFIIGFSVFLYPLISRLYYRVEATQQIADFDAEKSKLSSEEVNRRLDLAHAFNESLVNVITEDPYAKERQNAGRAEYARMLEIREQIGHIQIPVIDTHIPIYAGTSEEVLQKGAAHLEGTSLPVGGNNTHTVITAHSGLPTARLFSDLQKVEIGDKFYIHNLGEILAYQVHQIKIIDPTDFSDLLVEEGHDYATLLTCTPIMINTHRLIVRGHRVPYNPTVDSKIIDANQKAFIYRYAFFAVLVLIVLIIIMIFRYRRLTKKMSKDIKELSEEIKTRKLIENAMDEDKGED